MRIPSIPVSSWIKVLNITNDGYREDVYRTDGYVGIGTSTPTHQLTFGTQTYPSGIALYNTSDQTTNYERGILNWDINNNFTIATQYGGTGTARNINLSAADGTSLILGAGSAVINSPFTVLGNVTALAPINTGHLTTKGYVDSIVQGLQWQAAVIDDTLSVPPPSPEVDDGYIVAGEFGDATATGAWLGKEEQIARWNGSNWNFTIPEDGYAVWVQNNDYLVVYNAEYPSGSWVQFGSTILHSALQGLGNDDHTIYLRVDGYRAMTGDLSMSGSTSVRTNTNEGLDFNAADDIDKIYGIATDRIGIKTNSIDRLEINNSGIDAYGNLQMHGGIILDATEALHLGTFANTGHTLTSGDVLVGGQLEVDGEIWADAGITIPVDELLVFSSSAGAEATYSVTFGQFGWELGSHNAFIIGSVGIQSQNYDHGAQTDPTVFIHSVIDPDTDNTQWLGLWHDQTNARITSGKGLVNLGTAAVTSKSLGVGDVLVGGALEVDGTAYFELGAQVSNGNLTVAGSSGVVIGGTTGMTLLANTTNTQFLAMIASNVGRNLILADYGTGTVKDFNHATSINPTLWIQSATDPTIDDTQWISVHHDQTDGIITSGTGHIRLSPADGYVTSDGYIIPVLDNVYGLGTDGYRWSDLFLGPQSLYMISRSSDPGNLQDKNFSFVIGSDGKLRLNDGPVVIAEFGSDSGAVFPAGGSSVSQTNGFIGADGYIAFFTGNNQIAGDNDLFFNRTTETLQIAKKITLDAGLIGSATSPALAFGDGDSGIYEISDDVFRWSIAGVATWQFSATTFGAVNTFRPALKNIDTNITTPNILPNSGDTDSGIGQQALDSISIITGSVEGLRITETVGNIETDIMGVLGLRESVVPDATDGYGKLYVQHDGYLYYKSPVGTQTNLLLGGASAPLYDITSVQSSNINVQIDSVVRCDSSGGGFTVTLPAPVGYTGRTIIVKNTTASTNTITIDVSGGFFIDGLSSVTIEEGFTAITFVSYGDEWGRI